MSNTSVQHLVEAALYVDDLDRAEAFYREVLGLELIGKEPGRHVFFRAGQGVLLICNPESTQKQGLFPAHGAKGPGHAALGIAADAVDFWRRRLQECGVQIEKETTWPKGGQSLYFRDPAGNSVELVTPGCWGLPSGW
jgi:catechol 2,3-dioxygenase-like lactoylglutathione lyase family enzyme